eukprot:TRINITY_DN5237_c0_g1_i1.p1 TRINITY_DN5237_c0_g1~~TRINITY_DN5237_c0_g1_i1.p1  ORF type:complete len:236 (-),score=70.11 TRINITY_DN5237_c0_g1_i1:137-844(-)
MSSDSPKEGGFVEPDDSTDLIRYGGKLANPQAQSELMYLVMVGKSSLKAIPKETADERWGQLQAKYEGLILQAEDMFSVEKRKKELQEQQSALKKRIRDEFILSCVKDEVQKGAMLHYADKEGLTPLHYLAMAGYTTTLRWCAKNGSKLHVRGLKGGTPVYWAAHCRENESIEYLVMAGAHVDTKDDEGISALQIAISKMIHPPSVQSLIENECTITEQDLLIAAKNRKTIAKKI